MNAGVMPEKKKNLISFCNCRMFIQCNVYGEGLMLCPFQISPVFDLWMDLGTKSMLPVQQGDCIENFFYI